MFKLFSNNALEETDKIHPKLRKQPAEISCHNLTAEEIKELEDYRMRQAIRLTKRRETYNAQRTRSKQPK